MPAIRKASLLEAKRGLVSSASSTQVNSQTSVRRGIPSDERVRYVKSRLIPVLGEDATEAIGLY